MGLNFKGMFENSEIEEEYDMSEDAQGPNSKLVLHQPRAFSESQQIADYLKSEVTVLVNLKKVANDEEQRIIDFLWGTLYAIGGELQKVGPRIFLCAPRMVQVQGRIADDENVDNNW